jgi:hypothetical protein
MIKKLSIFLILAAMIALLIPAAHAVAIGASPATLNFEVPKGGAVEKTLQISTNSEEYITFNLEKSSSIADYITLSSETGKIKSGEPYDLTVKVSVPRKTELGTYDGIISVKTTGTGSVSGGSGSVISTGVTVRAAITVVPATSSGLGAVVLLAIVLVAVAGAAWFFLRKKK